MKLSKIQLARIRWAADPRAEARGGFWVMLLVQIALFVLSDLLRPKPELENAKPSGLGDFRFPTATEGRYIPIIWGTVRIEGPNVVWWGDLLQEAIKEKVKTGLFSSEEITKGFRYHIGIQQALCMGNSASAAEQVILRQVYVDDKLVGDYTGTPIVHDGVFTIDKPDLFGGEELGQGGIVGTLRFFAGTNTQSASTYISRFQKEPAVTGVTPAYRDLCYVAPDTTNVLVGTSSSIKKWSWGVRRITDGLALPSGHELVVQGANPANVLHEILTDNDFGYGFDVASIDAANFTTAAATLASEGNGFSFILDRVEDLGETVRRVEKQIDGILFKNPISGLWQIKLIRADYDVLTITEVNVDNLKELVKFTRSTWEGTSNQVRIPFNEQEDNYKDTFGFAQDMANVRIVGANVSVTITHPGVKDAALANSIAWRELRTLAIPMAQGSFIVDRSLYGLAPGDVFAFTDPDIGFIRLPMRIKRIDYGGLLDGQIRIEAMQDIFFAAAGVFANPPTSGWTPPSDVLVDFAEFHVFEAPRGLTLRDPASSSPYVDKVYAAGRRQGAEVTFRMLQRNSSGTPSGAYAQFGQVFGFQLVGELLNDLDLASSNPATTVLVVPSPDSQSKISGAFPSAASDTNELGLELLTLCRIDDEFILVSYAQDNAANVQLNDVYRGVLDSVQADHLAGAKVSMLFVGAGISDTSIPAGNDVDVKLLPRSTSALLPEGSATTTALTMSNRTRRPYAPASVRLNGILMDRTNVSLTGAGAGEDVGVEFDNVVRRDFRTVNEIPQLTVDAATDVPDFPAANTTRVDFEVRNGVTLLAEVTNIDGRSQTIRLYDILAALDTTTLPASLTFAVGQRHTFDSTTYLSRVKLEVVSTVSSPLIGKHAFGELDDSDISNTFVVVAPSVDHVFNLSTSFTVGDVEYRINAGSWLTLIAAGGTGPGTIPNASLSASDTIEIRHLSTDTTPQKLLTMTVSGTEEAYAILIS